MSTINGPAPGTIVHNEHNTVVISGDSASKTFMTVEQFDREREFYTIFSKFFNVPKVLRVDPETQTICYEYIRGRTLRESDVLSSFSSSDLISLRNRIPHIEGEPVKSPFMVLFPRHIIDSQLVHGDFRLDNLIVTNNGGIYLIDFESGNYLFREFDDVYMYLSLLRVDEEKAKDYYKRSGAEQQKERALYAELFYINGVLINSKISLKQKRFWIIREAKLIEGIKSLERTNEQCE